MATSGASTGAHGLGCNRAEQARWPCLNAGRGTPSVSGAGDGRNFQNATRINRWRHVGAQALKKSRLHVESDRSTDPPSLKPSDLNSGRRIAVALRFAQKNGPLCRGHLQVQSRDFKR